MKRMILSATERSARKTKQEIFEEKMYEFSEKYYSVLSEAYASLPAETSDGDAYSYSYSPGANIWIGNTAIRRFYNEGCFELIIQPSELYNAAGSHLGLPESPRGHRWGELQMSAVPKRIKDEVKTYINEFAAVLEEGGLDVIQIRKVYDDFVVAVRPR